MPYVDTHAEMRTFTRARDAHTPDELWLLQHCPVFTLGQAGDAAHVLDAGDIEVVATDRGGQVTYHGPGQLVAYTLVDLARLGVGVRTFVCALEQLVIDVTQGLDPAIDARRRNGAPGVYVGDAKLAALGLRVHKGRSYHGLAINVALDLAPFARINPCGYEGLVVTSLAELGVDASVDDVANRVAARFGALVDVS